MFSVYHVRTAKWGTSGHRVLRPYRTCKNRVILPNVPMTFWRFQHVIHCSWYCGSAFCKNAIFHLMMLRLLFTSKEFQNMIQQERKEDGKIDTVSIDCMCFVGVIFSYCTFLCTWTYSKNRLFHDYWCFCNKGLLYTLAWFNRCILSPAVHLDGSPVHEPVHYGFPGHFCFKLLFQ